MEALGSLAWQPQGANSSWFWLVKFRNPVELLLLEPTFLLCELEFYILCVLTYMHARRHGGRYLWLWWTTIAHGLTTECLSYWIPDIDNFWHAQSTTMFFGGREPFHIMCLYPGFIYTSCVAVSRLGVSEHVQPFLSGGLTGRKGDKTDFVEGRG